MKTSLLLILSSFIALGSEVSAQLRVPSPPRSPSSLRTRPVSVKPLSLPALSVDGVVTGVSVQTTASGGLRQTVSGLITQDVELPAQSGEKTVVKTLAGTQVAEVTLFDPAESSWTDSTASNNKNGQPYICSGGGVAGAAPAQNPLNDYVASAGTLFESRPYSSSGGADGAPLQIVPFPGRYTDGSLAQGVSYPNCGTENLSP